MRTQHLCVVAALTGVAVVVVVTVSGAAPASAHANLIRVAPADGATVTTEPSSVTLVFDEYVRAPSVVVVTDPAGHRVEKGEVRVHGDTARIRVRVNQPGPYTVAFRVASADGHAVVGRTSFTFRPSGATGPSPSATGSAVGHPHPEDSSAAPRGDWVVGTVAVAALVGGVALLTVRRRTLGTSPR